MTLVPLEVQCVKQEILGEFFVQQRRDLSAEEL
jgi:hypothetical protein